MKICVRFVALLLLATMLQSGLLISPSYLAIEQHILDYKYKYFPPQNTPSNKIVFVDIDDESIQMINIRKGPWPWTRDVWAETLKMITQAQPKAVLFDILLTEKAKFLDSDQKLALAIKDSSKASFAISFDTYEDKSRNQSPRRLPSSERSLSIKIENFFGTENSFTNYTRPYNAAWENLNHVHFVNSFKDTDGILRSTPIFLTYDKKIYPSLTLKALQLYLNNPKIILENDRLVLQNPTGTHDHALEIPLYRNNQSRFHFYRDNFQIVSLGSIYSNISHQDNTGSDFRSAIQLLESKFKGKIVIIGSSSPSLNDLKSTPLSKNYPGALLHATLISNILENHVLQTLPLPAGIALTLTILLLIQFSFGFFKIFFFKNAAPIIVISLYCLLNIYGFQFQNLDLASVGPVFFGLLIYIDNLVQFISHTSHESATKFAPTKQYQTLNS
jgi:adenylate cyclase